MNPETPPEEHLIWKGSPSQWTNFGVFFLCLLIAAGIVAAYYFYFAATVGPIVLLGLIVPAFVAFWRWLMTRCHVYEVTTERIRISTGFLSRHTTELELYRVRDYTMVEPFWLRVIARGNLVLQTADRTNPEVVIRAVPRVAELKDHIRTHTERLRRQRGVRDLEIDTP